MKRKTIEIEYPTEVSENNSPPTTYHARAALVIGGLVGLLVFAMANTMRISTMGQLRSGLIAGLSVAVLFGAWWTYKATTYQWRIGEIEMRRRWKREDKRAEGESETETETDIAPPKAAGLDRLARLLIEREYLDGLSTTREICEALGLATQTEWNAVNQVLKEAEIKSARGWAAESYDQAIRQYRARVRVDGGNILIQKSENEWQRLSVTV